MTERPRYALHPGVVYSRDGDDHYVGGPALAELYRVRLGTEAIVWDDAEPRTFAGRRPEDFTHLWPRGDGQYRRPA